MFTGTGEPDRHQGRWGDYSMTTIDPADDMTFWTMRMNTTQHQQF